MSCSFWAFCDVYGVNNIIVGKTLLVVKIKTFTDQNDLTCFCLRDQAIEEEVALLIICYHVIRLIIS